MLQYTLMAWCVLPAPPLGLGVEAKPAWRSRVHADTPVGHCGRAIQTGARRDDPRAFGPRAARAIMWALAGRGAQAGPARFASPNPTEVGSGNTASGKRPGRRRLRDDSPACRCRGNRVRVRARLECPRAVPDGEPLANCSLLCHYRNRGCGIAEREGHNVGRPTGDACSAHLPNSGAASSGRDRPRVPGRLARASVRRHVRPARSKRAGYD